MTSLESLPQEIILLIVEFLDKTDALCWAFTSQSFYVRLAKARAWTRESPKNHVEKLRRAQILHRLLPSGRRRYLCQICCVTHPVQRVPLPSCRYPGVSSVCGTIHVPLPCVGPWLDQGRLMANECSRPFEGGTFFSYKLPFVYAQLAMERHRYGPEWGLPLDWLSGSIFYVNETALCCRDAGRRGRRCSMVNVEPIVNADMLCLRVQTINIYNAALQHCRANWDMDWSICAHIFTHVWNEHSSAQTDGRTYYTCLVCAMSFCVRHISLGSSVAWVVTKWLCLGDGKDVSDYSWQRHCCSWPQLARQYHSGYFSWARNSSWREDTRGMLLQAETKLARDLRQSFEAKATRSYEALMDDDISRLLDDTFKNDLIHDPGQNFYHEKIKKRFG